MAERFLLHDRPGADEGHVDGQFYELAGDASVTQESQGSGSDTQQCLGYGNANPWPFHLDESAVHGVGSASQTDVVMSVIPAHQANPWPYHGREDDADEPASSNEGKEGESEQSDCIEMKASCCSNVSQDEGGSFFLPNNGQYVIGNQETPDVSFSVGTLDASLVPAPLKISRPSSSSGLPSQSGYSNGYRDVVPSARLNLRSGGGSDEIYRSFPEKGSSPMEHAKDTYQALTENAKYAPYPNASIYLVSSNSERLPAMPLQGLQAISGQHIDSERPSASIGDAIEYNGGERVAQRRSTVVLEDDSQHTSALLSTEHPLVAMKTENRETGGFMVDGSTPFPPTPGGQKVQYRHSAQLAHATGNESKAASEPPPPYPGSERVKFTDGLECREGPDCTMPVGHDEGMKCRVPQQGTEVNSTAAPHGCSIRPPPPLPPRPMSSHLPMGFNQQQTSATILFPPPPKRQDAPSLQSHSESHRVPSPMKLLGSSSAKRLLEKTNQVIEETLDSVLQGSSGHLGRPASVASSQSVPARRVSPYLPRGQHLHSQQPIHHRPGYGS